MPVRQIDIARKLGVSQQAVSAVLTFGGRGHVRVSESTAQRIRDAARQMGYRPFRPAQQLAGRDAGVIGVLIGARSARVHYLHLAELERCAFAAGLRLSVALINDVAQVVPYLTDFESRGVRTLVCLHHEMPGDNHTIPQLVKHFPRVVYLSQPAGVEAAEVVDMDFADSSRQVVEHLRSRGRRRIGMALISRAGVAHATRARGFIRVMAEQRGFDPKTQVWIFDEQRPTPQFDLRQINDHLVEQWIRPQGLEAVIASNDEWAAHLVKGLKKHGLRVPQDVAVVGQDNLDVAQACDPELTTVDLCMDQVAAAFIGLLVKPALPGRGAAVHPVIKPRLIVREST